MTATVIDSISFFILISGGLKTTRLTNLIRFEPTFVTKRCVFARSHPCKFLFQGYAGSLSSEADPLEECPIS